MDEQKLENTIQFLVENQAVLHSDIEGLKEGQQRTTEQIQQLAESQQKTDAQIAALAEEMRGGFSGLIQEMRIGFENLIIANEVTRDLANKIGQLAMQTSQRVTKIEDQNGDHSH
jgi:hypothetical protein